jgi:hypothetical protein
MPSYRAARRRDPKIRTDVRCQYGGHESPHVGTVASTSRRIRPGGRGGHLVVDAPGLGQCVPRHDLVVGVAKLCWRLWASAQPDREPGYD